MANTAGQYDNSRHTTMENKMHCNKEFGIAGKFGSTEKRFRGGIFPSRQHVDRKRFPVPGQCIV